MKFTIYGERQSGTNYLAKVMYDNFDVEHVLLPDSIDGSKHWFGNEKNIESIQHTFDCMILCIVRNPIDWIMSFFNNPHQQSPSRITDLLTFISTEFYSTLQSTGTELELRRYKDIFEMRCVKNLFLYSTIPALTPNGYFIKYEDLKHTPDTILTNIKHKFKLTPKHNTFIIENKRIIPQNFQLMSHMPRQTRGSNQFQTDDGMIKENYTIHDVLIKNIIKTRLNFEVENLIGYDKETIMARLI